MANSVVDLKKAKQAIYRRRWRDKNRAKLNAYNRQYRKDNKDIVKSYKQKWVIANTDHINKKNREWRKLNPEKAKIRSTITRLKAVLPKRRYLDSIKAEIGCKYCFFKDPRALEFHHRDPKTKLFNVSSDLTSRKFAELKNEVKKCDVVCSNCHNILHAKDITVLEHKLDELLGIQVSCIPSLKKVYTGEESYSGGSCHSYKCLP